MAASRSMSSRASDRTSGNVLGASSLPQIGGDDGLKVVGFPATRSTTSGLTITALEKKLDSAFVSMYKSRQSRTRGLASLFEKAQQSCARSQARSSRATPSSGSRSTSRATALAPGKRLDSSSLKLSMQEFRVFLEYLSFTVTPEQLQQLFKQCDVDQDGFVSLTELMEHISPSFVETSTLRWSEHKPTPPSSGRVGSTSITMNSGVESLLSDLIQKLNGRVSHAQDMFMMLHELDMMASTDFHPEKQHTLQLEEFRRLLDFLQLPASPEESRGLFDRLRGDKSGLSVHALVAVAIPTSGMIELPGLVHPHHDKANVKEDIHQQRTVIASDPMGRGVTSVSDIERELKTKAIAKVKHISDLFYQLYRLGVWGDDDTGGVKHMTVDQFHEIIQKLGLTVSDEDALVLYQRYKKPEDPGLAFSDLVAALTPKWSGRRMTLPSENLPQEREKERMHYSNVNAMQDHVELVDQSALDDRAHRAEAEERARAEAEAKQRQMAELETRSSHDDAVEVEQDMKMADEKSASPPATAEVPPLNFSAPTKTVSRNKKSVPKTTKPKPKAKPPTPKVASFTPRYEPRATVSVTARSVASHKAAPAGKKHTSRDSKSKPAAEPSGPKVSTFRANATAWDTRH